MAFQDRQWVGLLTDLHEILRFSRDAALCAISGWLHDL
jgi:hypothetical protein